MASTREEKKKAREYYKKHPAYRRKKIKETADDHKEHRLEHNKNAREYYHSNTNYRKRRIRQVKAYNKGRKGK